MVRLRVVPPPVVAKIAPVFQFLYGAIEGWEAYVFTNGFTLFQFLYGAIEGNN